MSNELTNPIEVEEIYLKRNAYALLGIGLYFGIDAVGDDIYRLIKGNDFLISAGATIAFAVFIFYMIATIKSFVALLRVKGTLSLKGNFKDEYHTYVNNKGRELAFELTFIALFVTSVVINFSEVPLFEFLSTGQLMSGLVSVITLSYAIPVIYLLRKDQGEYAGE